MLLAAAAATPLGTGIEQEEPCFVCTDDACPVLIEDLHTACEDECGTPALTVCVDFECPAGTGESRTWQCKDPQRDVRTG